LKDFDVSLGSEKDSCSLMQQYHFRCLAFFSFSLFLLFFSCTVFRRDVFPELGGKFFSFGPETEPCEEQGSAQVRDGFFPILEIAFFEQGSEVIPEGC